MAIKDHDEFVNDLKGIVKNQSVKMPPHLTRAPKPTSRELLYLAANAHADGPDELLTLLKEGEAYFHDLMQAYHDRMHKIMGELYNGGSWTNPDGTPVVSSPGDTPRAINQIQELVRDATRELDNRYKDYAHDMQLFGARHIHMRHAVLVAVTKLSQMRNQAYNDMVLAQATYTSKAVAWKPKSASPFASLGRWISGAINSVSKFMGGIYNALRKAWEGFITAAKAACLALKSGLSAADKTKAKAATAPYASGFPKKDVAGALTAARKSHKKEFDVLYAFGKARKDKITPEVTSAANRLASHFAPQVKQVQSHYAAVRGKPVSHKAFSLAIGGEGDYSLGLGISLGFGILIEFSDPVQTYRYVSIGGSGGWQGGGEFLYTLGFMMSQQAFEGLGVSEIIEGGVEEVGLFKAGVTVSPFGFQGITIGVGIGAGLSAALEGSYTLVVKAHG